VWAYTWPFVGSVNCERKYGIVFASAEKLVTGNPTEYFGLPMPSSRKVGAAARVPVAKSMTLTATAVTPRAAAEMTSTTRRVLF
jgi:hypothetical protein